MTKPTYVDDHAAITEVLNKYIEGCKQANSAIMKPAFAEEATIFGMENGKLSSGAIEVLYKGIDTAFRPSPEARAVFAYMDINHTAASARVDSNDVSGFCFTDYFNLLKIDGTWTIIAKSTTPTTRLPPDRRMHERYLTKKGWLNCQAIISRHVAIGITTRDME
ncbi:nuclear transport factor 2 family protein [Phyllobacterium sp. TAF24]|uniref:nuclear transport factor 2 family protein n=1 Tax=Phyllobacterium sp. TAF24 TaxID=3233068 RepID=UPI003F952193